VILFGLVEFCVGLRFSGLNCLGLGWFGVIRVHLRLCSFPVLFLLSHTRSIQDVPGGKVDILGDHSIGHSKQKIVYVHLSCSERLPR
jgi:hypothetical protein